MNLGSNWNFLSLPRHIFANLVEMSVHQNTRDNKYAVLMKTAGGQSYSSAYFDSRYGAKAEFDRIQRFNAGDFSEFDETKIELTKPEKVLFTLARETGYSGFKVCMTLPGETRSYEVGSTSTWCEAVHQTVLLNLQGQALLEMFNREYSDPVKARRLIPNHKR
jgi:hypothetical protein